MQQINHQNIMKVHESVRDVEIVLPYHMKFASASLQTNQLKLQNQEELQMLRDYIDNRGNLKLLEEQDLRNSEILMKVDDLQMLYTQVVMLQRCSYLVMDYAARHNLFHYISRKRFSEQATIYYTR